MATIGFNALWLLCVILLLIAFFLAIRRRRLAARAEGIFFLMQIKTQMLIDI